MANSRSIVPAPVKTRLPYGLLSVVEDRGNGPADLRGHWKSGITWLNVCPALETTYSECTSENAGIDASLPAPDAKAETAERTFWGATPFTVYGEIDCSPVGFWDNANETLARTFSEAEWLAVENSFSTGEAGGQPIVFPHLVSDTEVQDADGIFLQLAATVPVTGAMSIAEAVGVIDAELGLCLSGRGVLHVPTALYALMLESHLVTERDGVLYSPAGHKITLSPAYSGAAPDGTVTDGIAWIYGTGPVFMYRSVGRFLGTPTESLDRSVDTLKRIYERTYVVGYDCCLTAVPVTAIQ